MKSLGYSSQRFVGLQVPAALSLRQAICRTFENHPPGEEVRIILMSQVLVHKSQKMSQNASWTKQEFGPNKLA